MTPAQRVNPGEFLPPDCRTLCFSQTERVE
jgi:hypothetical protein